MANKIKGLMKGKVKELRGAYGQPLGKKVSIKVEKEDLKRFGEMCCEYIELEARKAARYSTALPKSEEFFKSFSYRIVGSSTVKILSSWPWMEIYQNLAKQSGDKDLAFGKPRPFRMTWLTQQAGVKKVPLVDKRGQVVVRTAPLKVKDAWIHPGIARHTFVNKGMMRAREAFIQHLVSEQAQKIFGGGSR